MKLEDFIDLIDTKEMDSVVDFIDEDDIRIDMLSRKLKEMHLHMTSHLEDITGIKLNELNVKLSENSVYTTMTFVFEATNVTYKDNRTYTIRF